MTDDRRVIFVFGSNRAGRHGRGAALTAVQRWGAQPGVGEGLVGQSYALPTKDHGLHVLPLPAIQEHVNRFLACSQHYYRLRFLITEIGCGLAGYKPAEIAPLFVQARECTNLWFPERFARLLAVDRVSFNRDNSRADPFRSSQT